MMRGLGIFFLFLISIYSGSAMVKQVNQSSENIMSQKIIIDPYYNEKGLYQNMPRLAYSTFLRDYIKLTNVDNLPVIKLTNHSNSAYTYTIIFSINQQEVKDIEII